MLSAHFLLPLISLIQRGEKGGGAQLKGRPCSLTYVAVVGAGSGVAAPRSPGMLDGPLLNRSEPVLLLAGASSTGTG